MDFGDTVGVSTAAGGPGGDRITFDIANSIISTQAFTCTSHPGQFECVNTHIQRRSKQVCVPVNLLKTAKVPGAQLVRSYMRLNDDLLQLYDVLFMYHCIFVKICNYYLIAVRIK